MKYLASKPFIAAAALMTFVIVVKISSYEVKADAAIKDQPNKVVRTVSLNSDKVIKVPAKQVQTKSTGDSNSASKKAVSRKNTPSRGGSGLQSKATSGNGSVVSEAYKHLGKSYSWGASGPNAFDCSGLTAYVYKAFGVSLPHNSRSQFGYGQAVRKEDLSLGDLVFFNTGGGISHVGIYTGGGKFIHAANPRKGVTVSSLSEGYYSKRFVGAKRILK